MVAAGILVGGLFLWTEHYLTLNRLSPGYAIYILFLVLGTVGFSIATLLTKRLTAGNSFATAHFGTTIALYLWAMGGLFEVLTHPKVNLAGGDTALRISIVIAAYGILINAILVARRRDKTFRNGRTTRHSPSRFMR